ncbi:4'-phosphopantetheinyl transferase family protein [Paenibacillus hexagrammi]|uniref:4'-phosphopantetheinyl transferase superfamily protein n=1 Tax=Paenibacillus hexagrammi TaxID=2908839 RepID=A0ABY3SL21_9BACL|nr:4'-phosphopantetheinyl transferase superfamily protein [Paenibacillus sp. YPD9-1]UJF34754.1 4'-phosphopantetheinyl transferase superfamily protein [Paenibacillus sp. YPD9-1]
MTTRITVLKLPVSLDPQYLEMLLQKASAEKLNKIKKFHKTPDSYRSLLGDLLVRAIVSTEYNLPNEQIHFGYHPYGKPYLLYQPHFSFNLSHSGDWIALIWNTTGSVIGVDVEQIGTAHINIAKQFFCRDEYMDLLNKDGIEQTEYFFKLWTLKESYMKARGMGLSIPMNSFSFKHSKENFWFSPQADDYYFYSCHLDAMHLLAACTQEDDLSRQIVEVPLAFIHCLW